MDEAVVLYHTRARNRVFFISVLLLSFVQIRRIPHFSRFRVIYGRFSSWHHRRDLDVHHLLPSARSEQDTLENDTSGGTNTFPLYNECRGRGGCWEEKYVTVWAHCPHMSTLSQRGTFFCSEHEWECTPDPETLVILGSGSRSLRRNWLDCVACTTSASSTHKLPLSHTNTAIIQSLLSAWCCTVLCNMLLSYLLFFPFCLTALCSFLSSSFQTVSILEQRLTLTENKLKECMDN